MIKPVNGHLLIEPIAVDSFMATQKDTFQEIGIVVDYDDHFLVKPNSEISPFIPRVPTFFIKKGDKVYFDSWLAAKYPKEGGNHDEFYWLVKCEDVRAIDEYVEPSVSK